MGQRDTWDTALGQTHATENSMTDQTEERLKQLRHQWLA